PAPTLTNTPNSGHSPTPTLVVPTLATAPPAAAAARSDGHDGTARRRRPAAPTDDRSRRTPRASGAIAPAAASTTNSLTPRTVARTAPAPSTPSHGVFTAERPSPQSAWTTTPMTTGLTPQRTPGAARTVPNRT